MMGALMLKNDNKLMGLYDELSTFMAQINIYRGKGLIESHDLATFLSLYNAKSWNRAINLYHHNLVCLILQYQVKQIFTCNQQV